MSFEPGAVPEGGLAVGTGLVLIQMGNEVGSLMGEPLVAAEGSLGAEGAVALGAVPWAGENERGAGVREGRRGSPTPEGGREAFHPEGAAKSGEAVEVAQRAVEELGGAGVGEKLEVVQDSRDPGEVERGLEE
eukprot:358797-Prorocentrum_lima.AAC.1